MADLQYLADLLMRTTLSDTTTIRKTEAELEELSKTGRFVELLLGIPRIEGISDQLAMLACVYSLQYARNLVLWRNQAAINIAAQMMLGFLANRSIPLKHRDLVAAALAYLVLKDTNNIIASAFLPNTTDILAATFDQPLAQINIEYLALLSELLADKIVPATGPAAEAYLQKSFLALNNLIACILQYCSSYATSNAEQLDRSLLLVTKMLKVLKKYMRKLIFFSPRLVQILYSPHCSTMINAVLNFNLIQNSMAIPLFYYNPQGQPSPLLEHFHEAKALCIYILTQCVRHIINTKNSAQIQKSVILAQCPELIEAFSGAVSDLLGKVPYHRLKSKLQIKIIEEVYGFLVVMLRTCKFYRQMDSVKHLLIHSCLLKTLAFASEDYDNYYENPEEFVNSALHVAEVSTAALAKNNQPEVDDSQVGVTIYDTIRTHSAQLLKAYLNYVDGSMAELADFIMNVLEDKLNIEVSKNLILLLLCVVRDEARERTDFLCRVKKVVYDDLRDLELPTCSTEEPSSNRQSKFVDVQFSMTLLVLSRYLILFEELTDGFDGLEKAFCLVEKILLNEKVERVPKILAADIIVSIIKAEEGESYCQRTVQLLNSVMSAKNVDLRFLQCIQEIISQYDYVFENNFGCLITLVEKISAFLQQEIKKQKNQNQAIDKMWHILEQIASSKVLVQLMKDSLRRALQPLINMINGYNQFQLEEKTYATMVKIIEGTAEVGQFEVQILGILPQAFYTGSRKYRLSTPFSLLQHIIFYGKEVLSVDQILIKGLIFICVQNINTERVNEKPRPQSQYLEGIFTIQSLVISVGHTFNHDTWLRITRCLTKKIMEPSLLYDFVKAAVVSTLILILWGGHGFFSNQDNEQIMKLALKQAHNLTYAWPSKLFIISLSGLIQNYSLPFVCGRFVQLLDCLVTLCRISSESKPVADYSDLDFEHAQFERLSKHTFNIYSKVDEFQFFRSAVQSINSKAPGMIVGAFAELPEVKKDYMRGLLQTRRVGNEARIIYRPKHITGQAYQSTTKM